MLLKKLKNKLFICDGLTKKFKLKFLKYKKKLAKVKKTNNDGIIRELIFRIEKYSR
jgi:hypothetical protein